MNRSCGIEFLFAELEARDLALTVENHLRLATMFEATGDDLDFESLRNIVRCTVAKTPNERKAVDAAIDAWRRHFEEIAPKAVTVPGFEGSLEAGSTVGQKRRSPVLGRIASRLWNDRAGPIGLALVLGALVLVGYLAFGFDESPWSDQWRADPTSSRFRPSVRRPDGKIPSFPLPMAVESIVRRSTTVEWSFHVAFIIASALCLVVAVWIFRRSRLHGRPEWATEAPDAQVLLSPRTACRPTEVELTTRDDRRGIVWNIEHFVGDNLTSRVDLSRTVDATARQGGLVEFIHERETFPRQIWLLRDLRCPDADLEDLANEIASSLDRTGLPVRTGGFWGVPCDIRWDDTGDTVDIVTLEGRRDHVTAAILTDGQGIATALGSWQKNAAERALRSLATWPKCVVADFGSRVQTLPGCDVPAASAADWIEPLGIATVPPDGLATWLGGTRGDRASSVGDERLLIGHRALWAGSLAVSGRPFDRGTAHALARFLRLDVSPWDLRPILDRCEKVGSGYAWSPSDRRAWLRHLALAEANVGRVGIGTTLAASLRFWRGLLEESRDAIGDAGDSEETRRRRAEYDLEIALIDLWTDPEKAAQGLLALAELGHQEAVRRRLSGYWPANFAAPADSPDRSDATSDIVSLPWSWIADVEAGAYPDPRTQDILFRLGFAAGRLRLTRTLRVPRGIALIVPSLLMLAAFFGVRAFERHESETSTAVSETMPTQRMASVDLAAIPAGTYLMGSPEGEEGRIRNEVQHSVTLSAFLIGKTEVTRGLYRDVLNLESDLWDDSRSDDNLPANHVSWFDAVRFCNALSLRDGFSPAYQIGQGDRPDVALIPDRDGYRLPTEAQWEYACRAGTTTRFWKGDSEADLQEIGWFGEGVIGNVHPVAQKAPNAWGLYDVHGNAWEWCHDWSDTYQSNSVTDPAGPSGGSGRVVRGGCYWSGAAWCRSAQRSRDGPGRSSGFIGFRVALPLPLR